MLCVALLSLFVAVSLLEPEAQAPRIGEAQAGVAAPAALVSGFFTENVGQVAREVRIYTMGNPAVGFRDDGVMFVSRDGSGGAFAYMVRFLGANRVAPVGLEALPFRANFFLGGDATAWRVDVPTYRQVMYRDLYDGVDLAYVPAAGGVKYEFRLHPGADPSAIRMRFDGVASLAVRDGGLVLGTSGGTVRDSPPYSYGADGGEVRCEFVQRSTDTVGFACGAWDRRRDLVIDPVILLYSTFLGSSLSDVGYGLAVDAVGAAYVTGSTGATDFPATPGAYQSSYGGAGDAFVAKLAPDGRSLEYATFLGGVGWDYGYPIDVDGNGNAVVTGSTSSANFPVTAGAFQAALRGPRDAFVTKLNAAGNGLVYSTFLGGSSDDFADGIAVEATGAVIVAGVARSVDFPTTAGGWQPRWHGGGQDGFAAKFSANGALVYATYLGGGGTDFANEAAVDASGNAYITGTTSSLNLSTTPGAFQSAYAGGQSDAFVAKLTPIGAVMYSTYLGSPGTDDARGIDADGAGNAYVAGMTGAGFPTTPGAYDTTFNGNTETFITKLNASGTGLVYSTYIGGGGEDWGSWIEVDGPGFAHIASSTTSSNYPVTPDGYDATANGGFDVAVTILNATGRSLAYSSYLGGSDLDDVRGVGIGPFGETYVAGPTRSADFPTTVGAFDTTLGGFEDAYVAKIGTPPSPGVPDLVVRSSAISFNPPGPVDLGTPVEVRALVRNEGGSNAVSVDVRFYDGVPPSIQIDVDQRIPFIPFPSGQGVATVSWTAGSAGTHLICAAADPENGIGELDESNNMGCQLIEVRSGPPVTTLVLGSPTVIAGATYVTSATPISFSVLDESGTGIRNTTYRIDAGPWLDHASTGPFSLGTEGAHFLEWSSADNAGNVEPTRNATLYVDDTPPSTTLSVGTPNSSTGGMHVTTATVLALQAADGGAPPVGVAQAEYRVDGGSWQLFTGPFTMTGDGPHLLEYRSEDRLGNVEPSLPVTLFVDDLPPSITAVLGAPRYAAADLFIRSTTSIALSAVDGGASPAGLAFLEYSLGGAWTLYTVPFTVAGPDGPKTIAYRAADFLSNAALGSLTVVLDDTPPVTTVSPGSGTYTAGSSFTLAASDAGSGFASSEYRVDGGSWTEYSGPFSFPAGNHTIGFRSTDHLGNGETERTATVRILGAPIVAEQNWKPVVAAGFTGILAVFGAWSARRRPWRTGPRPSLRAFGFVSAPAVLAEASTGVLSLFTGLLAIPPILGIGTMVDLAILAAGVGISIRWARGDSGLKNH